MEEKERDNDALADVPTWATVVFFLFSVFMWRSMWNLIDIYFLPDQFALSNWLTLLFGTSGIAFLRWRFNTVHLYRVLQ